MSTPAKIALLVACFLWAISFIATKVAVESTPPLTVVALRLVPASLCFVAWYFFTRNKVNWGGLRWWLTLFVLSLLGVGHLAVQTVGMQYTTPSNASLYAVTAPISIAILARIFLAEGISIRKAIGILIALCGVLTVMGLDTLMTLKLQEHLPGDLLVFISIVMWGVFTVFGKKTTERLGALQMTGLVTLIGALWMAPLCQVELHLQTFQLSRISKEAWAAILFLGVTCSFLATLLYFLAVERSESQKVGVYLYTIPLMTAALSYFFRGESLGLNFFAGALLVLCGVWLTETG